MVLHIHFRNLVAHADHAMHAVTVLMTTEERRRNEKETHYRNAASCNQITHPNDRARDITYTLRPSPTLHTSHPRPRPHRLQKRPITPRQIRRAPHESIHAIKLLAHATLPVYVRPDNLQERVSNAL